MSSDPTEIDVLLDSYALSIAQRRVAWVKHRSELLPMVRAFQKLNATISYPDSLDVSLTGDKHTLAAAVRIFRSRGFITLSEPPEKGNSTWCAYFDRSGCDIRWWFSFASTICRRVKVGTRTVEQDVYETVCDEITLPEGAPA